MTDRKRKKLDSAARHERKVARLDSAVTRWKQRYEGAVGDDAKLAAAYDWNRAAIRLARELADEKLGDMYAASLHEGLVKTAVELGSDIGMML